MALSRKHSRALVALLLSVLTSLLPGQLPTFGPEVRANGIVLAVATNGSDIFLGGAFEEFNGDGSTRGLLRLNASAQKNPTWDIQEANVVSDLAVVGDYLYVAGTFTTIRTFSSGVINRSRLARIHLTGPNEGKVDATWAPSVNGPVNLIEPGGGGIYIAGSFSSVNGVARTRMANIGLDAAATLNASFNPAPDGTVEAMDVGVGGLYVGGSFTLIGGRNQPFLARLNGSSADATWDPDINGSVGAILADGGDLYIGGSFNRVENTPHRSLARYDIGSAGVNFEGGWVPDPDGEVTNILSSGSNLYISGVFLEIDQTPQKFLARIEKSSGVPSTTFRPGVNGSIADMTLGAGGVLAVGQFTTSTGAASGAFASFSGGNGAASSTFRGNITTSGQIFSMIPTGDGGVFIGGLFDEVNGVRRTSLARINANGTLNTGFNPQLVGANRLINDMVLDGGNLYVAGDFFQAGSVETFHAARLSAGSGAASASFAVKPFAPLKSIAVSGTHVYVGGENLRFVEIAGSEDFEVVSNLARFDKTTALVDPIWRPFVTVNGNFAEASVESIKIGGGGVIIGGRFSFITDPENTSTATQRVCLAALSTSGWGQPIAGWGSTFFTQGGQIATIDKILQHNGSLYVAGDFAQVSGNQYFGVAKFNPSGGGWDSGFDVSPIRAIGGSFFPASVGAIAASGNAVYVGGQFDAVWDGTGFTSSPDIAKVDSSTGAPDLSWYPYQSSSVAELTYSGQNLWMAGPFSLLGPFETGGIVALKPNSAAYQSWLGNYFTPGQQGNSDFISPLVDTDGDGLTNFFESVFNLNPLIDDSSLVSSGTNAGLPSIGPQMIGGQRYMTMEFVRFKSSASADISVVPEFSSDLEEFSARGVEISTQSIDSLRERVTVRDATGNLPKAFLRYRITSNP